MASAAPVDEPLLSIRGLGVRYGRTIALETIDLDVRNGEFLTILGPSGSGKTTLLRLIGGFLEPSEGSILFDGADIAHVPIERRPFNTVFQDYALFPHMTVAQNTGYGLMVRGRPRAEIRARVAEYLEVVGLTGMEGRYPGQLSGGQRQRVALARALICAPRLLLLDEPLAAMDAGLRRQMQEFLKGLQRRTGVTFLFVTHDQDEAIALSDRICVMSGGRIEQVGSAEDVYYRPESRFVATFFGDNNLIDGCRVDGKGILVDTPFGTLVRDRPSRLAGREVTLCVRPENLSIRPADMPPLPGGLSIEARVEGVEFAGAVRRLDLRTGCGIGLSLKTMSHPGMPVPLRGETLHLSVAPEAAALIPAERRGP